MMLTCIVSIDNTFIQMYNVYLQSKLKKAMQGKNIIKNSACPFIS